MAPFDTDTTAEGSILSTTSASAGGDSGAATSLSTSANATITMDTTTNTATTAAASLPRSQSLMVTESLSGLGQMTQSLLRTMRLDVVLLGSREEEMDSVLAELECQWEMMQGLLLEEKRRRAEDDNEEGETTKAKTKDRKGDKKPTVLDNIDWDGHDNEDRLESTMSQSTIVPKERPKILEEENQLRNSNFDWGSRRTTMESSTEGVTLSDLFNVIGRTDGSDDGDNQTQQSKFSWSLFGNNNTSNSNNDGNGKNQKTVESQQLPFQIFGGKRRQENQNEEGSVARSWVSWGSNSVNTDKQAVVAQNPLQRLFQRRSMNEPLLNSDTIKSLSHLESSLNSSNASLTQATAQTTDSNDNNSNVVDNEKCISSLLIKLRGCDSAASSLHQLHTYQNHNYCNLQYTRNTLQSSTAFTSAQNQTELQNLRAHLHFAKVEQRRKARFLEDSKRRKKKAVDQEGRLKEELESIRTELFMMQMQEESSRGEGGYADADDMVGAGGNDRREWSRRYDKVVIVGVRGEN